MSTGDINGDGLSDIVIGWHNVFGGGGALNSAGAVLVYFGQATSTGWSTVTNSDDWLPNITPSIALYGDAVNVKLAEYGAVGDFVSGNGRDEIAVKASGSVHVFDIGSLLAGTNTTAAVAGVDGLAPVASVSVKDSGLSSGSFATTLAAADVDGDGTDELVSAIRVLFTTDWQIATRTVRARPGVTVAKSTSTLSVLQRATSALPIPAHRHLSTPCGVSDNESFGQTIGVLKASNAASGDVADWILVETGSTDILRRLRAAHQAEASCRRSIQSLAVVQMLWAITTDSVLTFEATMMRTRLRRIAWAILMAQIRTI